MLPCEGIYEVKIVNGEGKLVVSVDGQFFRWSMSDESSRETDLLWNLFSTTGA